jgi:hypothetical protein
MKRFCLFIALVIWQPQVSCSQERDFAQEYGELSQKYVADLHLLAEQAKREELPAEQIAIAEQLQPRESGRWVFYFAQPKAKPLPPLTSVLTANYSQALRKLAYAAGEAGRGDLAWPWAHEAYKEDQSKGGREPFSDVVTNPHPAATARAGTGIHPKYGWGTGRHWQAESRRFIVDTNVNAKAGIELANDLERFHHVWQQMFPTVWTTPEKIKSRFRGEGTPLSIHFRFRVALFKDRTEYLRLLKQTKGAEVSTGIYLDEPRISAFYAGPESKQSTQFHEVTHQLFQECSMARPGIAAQENMWLIEAVALFMETYQEHAGYATLGGWDAENLQYARFRALGGDFYLPLDKLATLGRQELQEHTDIRRIYSEMAGLGHFFLTAEQGKYREAFVETLRLVYQNQASAATLSERINKPYSELDREYLAFLNVTDADLKRCPPQREMRKLSLRRTQITDAGLAAFKDCERLEWIDLSLTTTSDTGFGKFPPSTQLKQLFLEGTKITDASASLIAEFENLEELYLSDTSLTDAAIQELSKLKKLKHLDLAGCALTAAAVEHLSTMKSLTYLAVNRTNIPPEALVRLKKSLPKTLLGQ